MPWVQCSNCDTRFYSSAPLELLADDTCNLCGGKLVKIGNTQVENAEEKEPTKEMVNTKQTNSLLN